MMAEPPQAFVFDAYGTLFDVHSVAVVADDLAPGRGVELSRVWRAKQLEYTWLSSLMASATHPRRDFDDLTARALEHATEALGLELHADAKRRLCAAYLSLSPFPDARDALAALAPRPRWILSNGTAQSLGTLVQGSGLAPFLTGVWSVDEVDVYKPSPRVYELAQQRIGLPAASIAFVSSNAWDAIGAQSYGFRSFWINRGGAPLDRHGPPPSHVLASLAELPAMATR
jgi:2-haloacid dehalogenase